MVYFLQDCQSNAKPSEKDHNLPGTIGVAVSIPNHYTIEVVSVNTKLPNIIYLHVDLTSPVPRVLAAKPPLGVGQI
jgi:hypothetical protein